MKCVDKDINPDEEYADFESAREFVLEKDSRIDFLIPVYNKNLDSESPAYYIAIENKILAEEGEDQTCRYHEHIEKMNSSKLKENVYIFLNNKEQSPKSEAFKSVSYENLIKELRQIPLDFVVDLRRAFLFQEFLIHTEEYLIKNSFKLTQSNCKLIEYAPEIINAYSEDKGNEVIKKAYDECIKIKNIFFDMLHKNICEKYSKVQSLIIKKSSQNLYIQIFKEEWKKYNIHYEIIIQGVKTVQKSIPYNDCNFLLMIHCEGSDKLRDKLKEHLQIDKSKNYIFAKNFGVYEEKIETSNAFSNPDSVRNFINDVIEKLSELVKKTEESIDKFVYDIKI